MPTTICITHLHLVGFVSKSTWGLHTKDTETFWWLWTAAETEAWFDLCIFSQNMSETEQWLKTKELKSLLSSSQLEICIYLCHAFYMRTTALGTWYMLPHLTLPGEVLSDRINGTTQRLSNLGTVIKLVGSRLGLRALLGHQSHVSSLLNTEPCLRCCRNRRDPGRSRTALGSGNLCFWPSLPATQALGKLSHWGRERSCSTWPFFLLYCSPSQGRNRLASSEGLRAIIIQVNFSLRSIF